MNIQEFADDLANKLFNQQGKSRAVTPYTNCLYNGPNGRHCAVGHLIDAELYDKTLEGKLVSSFINIYPDTPTLFREVGRCILKKCPDDMLENDFKNALYRLQDYHDNYFTGAERLEVIRGHILNILQTSTEWYYSERYQKQNS
jgi:hypothetical protein